MCYDNAVGCFVRISWPGPTFHSVKLIMLSVNCGCAPMQTFIPATPQLLSNNAVYMDAHSNILEITTNMSARAYWHY